MRRFLIFLPLIACQWDAVAASSPVEINSQPHDGEGGVALSDLDGTPDRLLAVRPAPCPSGGGPLAYFGLTIKLTPQGVNDTDQCTFAQQIEIGHALNDLLLAYGIGDEGVGDGAAFIARVCDDPDGRRRLEEATDLYYSGGGSCRFCAVDSFDRRALRQQNPNWFSKTYSPKLEKVLSKAIAKAVVGKYVDCIGNEPQVSVTVHEMAASNVDYGC